MCPQRRSGGASPAVDRSPGSSHRRSSNILSSTTFTRPRRFRTVRRAVESSRRQAGCMSGTESRRKSHRLPSQVALAVSAALDKKAGDVAVLDLRTAGGFTDYFVICSGQNARQIRAIADAITEALAAHGAKPAHIEGYDRSEWVLLDYFDFVVHIFAPETRIFYGLEGLWGAAER